MRDCRRIVLLGMSSFVISRILEHVKYSVAVGAPANKCLAAESQRLLLCVFYPLHWISFSVGSYLIRIVIIINLFINQYK